MTTVESDYYAFMDFDSESSRDGLSYYVPYFDAGPVLELACGRGEFLRLLGEQGIEARGVDLDPGMVEAARAAGLAVELGDALDYLADVPTESLGGLFCAHFLEHLAAPDVENVYREAARVLRPGGTFVAAVPNAGCLSVLGYDFWRDPTHVRFYDPMVLAFFAQRAGLVVLDQGENPKNHAGPPPDTMPIALPDVASLAEPIARVQALAATLRDEPSGPSWARRFVRSRTRPYIDVATALTDLLTQLEERTRETQHHLYALRGTYSQLLAHLYPSNEVFVAAHKGAPTDAAP